MIYNKILLNFVLSIAIIMFLPSFSNSEQVTGTIDSFRDDGLTFYGLNVNDEKVIFLCPVWEPSENKGKEWIEELAGTNQPITLDGDIVEDDNGFSFKNNIFVRVNNNSIHTNNTIGPKIFGIQLGMSKKQCYDYLNSKRYRIYGLVEIVGRQIEDEIKNNDFSNTPLFKVYSQEPGKNIRLDMELNFNNKDELINITYYASIFNLRGKIDNNFVNLFINKFNLQSLKKEMTDISLNLLDNNNGYKISIYNYGVVISMIQKNSDLKFE